MGEVNLSEVLALFFKKSPAPFCILAWQTGTLVTANPAWHKQVKLSSEQLKDQLLATFSNVSNTLPHPFEHSFLIQEDGFVCFSLSTEWLGIQYISAAQHVPQLKHLETLSARKSELISHLSHELRTPLTAILGWPEMILDAQEPMPVLAIQAAEAIQRDGNFLNQLLESLLDLSQIESGRLRLFKDWVDLNILVKSACKMLEERVRFKSQALSIHVPDEPVYNRVDAVKIQQAMINYISNAIKYTPEGGHIEVVLYRDHDQDVFGVKDNGEGISESLQAEVFGKFVRAEEVLATKGAGIGLSLVKKLVELHQGKYWVNSTPGEGTQFFFALPRLEESHITLPEIQLLCITRHEEQRREMSQLLKEHPVVYRMRDTLPSLQEMTQREYDLIILSTDLNQTHTQAWERAVHTLFPKQKILAWLSPTYTPQKKANHPELLSYDGILRSPIQPEDLIQYIQKRRD